jgi:Uma2 family endonuclease
MKIGPEHHGRKMSLEDFEFVEVDESHLYELARGIVVASELAEYYHSMQLNAIDEYLWAFRIAHPEIIHMTLDGLNCKVLIPDWQSERHPDRAIYLSKPTGPKDDTVWRTWIPAMIIEVVSASSVDRDYVEKREEYWTLGAQEYWIVDAAVGKITQLRRGKSDWHAKELFSADFVETKLLPGFKMPCQPIFDAAAEQEDEE